MIPESSAFRPGSTSSQVKHESNKAIHDWRDFQRIKNDICGEEWEGLELYPAESRLVDPSNRFYLWCVPPGIITWGLEVPGRRVLTMAESIAPQRPTWEEVHPHARDV